MRVYIRIYGTSATMSEVVSVARIPVIGEELRCHGVTYEVRGVVLLARGEDEVMPEVDAEVGLARNIG